MALLQLDKFALLAIIIVFIVKSLAKEAAGFRIPVAQIALDIACGNTICYGHIGLSKARKTANTPVACLHVAKSCAVLHSGIPEQDAGKAASAPAIAGHIALCNAVGKLRRKSISYKAAGGVVSVHLDIGRAILKMDIVAIPHKTGCILGGADRAGHGAVFDD